MARTNDEIAKRLEDAHEGLLILAESFRPTAGNPNGTAKAEFTSKDGADTFTLSELAADLRANAADG